MWLLRRSASEQIPGGVHAIDLTQGLPGHAPSQSLTVSDSAKVKVIIAVSNSLPTIQQESSTAAMRPSRWVELDNPIGPSAGTATEVHELGDGARGLAGRSHCGLGGTAILRSRSAS